MIDCIQHILSCTLFVEIHYNFLPNKKNIKNHDLFFKWIRILSFYNLLKTLVTSDIKWLKKKIYDIKMFKSVTNIGWLLLRI